MYAYVLNYTFLTYKTMSYTLYKQYMHVYYNKNLTD